MGGGLHNCTIVRGMVLKNDAVGSIKRMEKVKVSTILVASFLWSLCAISQVELTDPFFRILKVNIT